MPSNGGSSSLNPAWQRSAFSFPLSLHATGLTMVISMSVLAGKAATPTHVLTGNGTSLGNAAMYASFMLAKSAS